MTRIGAIVRPQVPPERLRAVASAAADCGLSELWLWEDCFSESGVAPASAALAWTETVTVGVGLLPVPLRNVALTAMEIATLSRMFPGRCRIGLGHGVQGWMRQAGAAVDSPMTLLREHVTLLRRLLEGHEVTSGGRYTSLDAVRLDWPPTVPQPLLVGATGPRTLELSGELADGTILTSSTSLEGLLDARRHIDAGRATSGSAAHDVVVFVLAATGPDAAQRLAQEQHATGRTTGVAGSADEVAAAVLEYVEAGATTVVLEPTADEPDPEGFVAFAGREVQPLVT